MFCGTVFTSTFDASSIEQVAAHEEVCKDNPSNMCTFCGQKFGGPISDGPALIRSKINSHLSVCPMNPHNAATVTDSLKHTYRRANQANTCTHMRNTLVWLQCSYCGRHFQSDSRGSAQTHRKYHAQLCGDNPANWCRYCGLRFSGTEPEQALRRRRAHEHNCCERPHAERDYGVGYVPSGESQRARASSSKLQSGATSRESNVDSVLKQVKRELQQCSPPDLRRRLRQLQLKYHPDKNSDPNAVEIFNYVQRVWDSAFKISQIKGSS